MSAYHSQAIEPNIEPTWDLPALEAIDRLIPGDLFVFVAAHPGRPEIFANWLDGAVVDENDADAVVEGILRKYEFIESFFGSDRQTEEYKIRILVEVTMVDRRSQEVIVGPQRVTGEGTYLLEDGPDGEQAARDLAAQEIVEGILNMVIEEW